MDISENIKAVAKRHGKSLLDVAALMPNDRARDKEVGVTKATISRQIHGNLTINKLEQLAAVIGCDVSEFFGNAGTAMQPERALNAFVEYKGKIAQASTLDELKAIVTDIEQGNGTSLTHWR